MTPDMTFISRFDYGGTSFELAFHSQADHIFRQVQGNGTFYEIDLLKALRPLIQPDDLVVDVGANIGNHTVFFAGVASCRVVAFEPVTQAVRLLRTNVDNNQLTDRVQIRECALGEAKGMASVDEFVENNLGATRLVISEEGTIATMPLDAAPEVAEHRVALIKIDVEGMELQVLRGAVGVLRRDRPILVCECAADADLLVINELLSSLAYSSTESFNATPTHIFLPNEWVGTEDYPRVQYFEDALARTSVQLRSLLNGTVKTRNMITALTRRIDDVTLKMEKRQLEPDIGEPMQNE